MNMSLSLSLQRDALRRLARHRPDVAKACALSGVSSVFAMATLEAPKHSHTHETSETGEEAPGGVVLLVQGPEFFAEFDKHAAPEQTSEPADASDEPAGSLRCYVLTTNPSLENGVEITRVNLTDPLHDVLRWWPGGNGGLILQLGPYHIKRLAVEWDNSTSDGEWRSRLENVLDLREIGEVGKNEVTVKTVQIAHADGDQVFAAALVRPSRRSGGDGDDNEDGNDEIVDGGPNIQPPPPDVTPLELHHLIPGRGWRKAGIVPALSERLALSADGTAAAWAVMSSHVSEEAERGEVFACVLGSGDDDDDDDDDDAAVVVQLTEGAGRIGLVAVSPTGSHVVYTANYSVDRPITTHLRLFSHDLRSSSVGVAGSNNNQRRELVPQTTPESHIDDMGFVEVGDAFLSDEEQQHDVGVLAITRIVGCDAQSSVYRLRQIHIHSEETAEADDTYLCADVIADLPTAVARKAPPPCLLSNNKDAESITDTAWVFVTESADSLPYVSFGGAKVDCLPHDPSYASAFESKRISVLSTNETKLDALLYVPRDAKPDAPLIFHLHGGPAGAFRDVYRNAADHTRYPFRPLLVAGFRVIMPLFRGTLGYGDNFSAANIAKQGFVDVDDIMATIERCRELGIITSATQLGVFGGSYGGFLTNRVMSAFPSVFSAGVSEVCL
jgi:Prolyl oligopeptidase family